jgi:hypothetical protein
MPELWLRSAVEAAPHLLAAIRPSGKNPGLIGSPAPKRPHAEEPPTDPTAVPRAVAHARARRRARVEHRQELRRARVRFLVLLGVLLFVTIVLALSIWEKIQTAFGI